VGSERRKIDPRGIAKADLVFVPLEDGDRTEGLKAMDVRVITVDLNPLSRTARKADITIVDNLVRCMPLLAEKVRELAPQSSRRNGAFPSYDNGAQLKRMVDYISARLGQLQPGSEE
jgi:4-phosphopantoate--beta-alanine ligase